MEIKTGNVFIRKNGPMEVGQHCIGHEHNFDHVTICFTGALRIVRDGFAMEIKSPRVGYDGPSHVLIKAGVRHEIKALEPDTIFWCVYSHRNPQGEVVVQYEGFDDAYGTWLTTAD